MARAVAWTVLLLGVAHLVFGLIRFRQPLAGAWADGFIGHFTRPEIRRTAFWFLASGPLLVLIGHLAVRAVDRGDRGLLGIVGAYLSAAGALGVACFPASPLWALVVLGPLLMRSSI